MPEGTNYSLLAFDVGEKKIGVARASSLARLPQPAGLIPVDGHEFETIRNLINTEGASVLVVGLPRNLSGLDTDQTRAARDFADRLRQEVGLEVELQDEAGTSKQAEAELAQSKRHYSVDELAATYILQDYLETHV